MQPKREFRHTFLSLQRQGMKRRGRQIRRMQIMSGLAVLFLSVTLLFQDNMSGYQMEMNYRSYGKWFYRQPEELAAVDHPYLERSGKVTVGTEIYPKPKNCDGRETWQVDPNNTDLSSRMFLGTMEEQTRKNANISLYEGRMPRKSGEIAMELGLLEALGCDYEIGQSISFYVAEDNDTIRHAAKGEKLSLHLLTFRLTGTIKGYTNTWVGGGDLPSALITEKEYQTLLQRGMMTQTRSFLFYQLKEAYSEIDVNEYANSLSQMIMKTAGSGDATAESLGYAYNSYVYGNPFWGSREMYRNITLLLICVGAAALGYLMSAYLSRRKVHYYKLRSIGATAFQIQKMALYECAYSTIPTAGICLAASYAMSAGIVWMVAKVTGIRYFYCFDWATLGQIVFCVVAVILLSMGIAVGLLRAKRIEEKRKEITRQTLRRLGRRAARRDKRNRRIGRNEFLKRERLQHPVQHWLLRLMGVVACAVILSCLAQIKKSAVRYQNVTYEYTDYVLQMPGHIQHEWKENGSGNATGSLSFDAYLLDQTIPPAMMENLREMKGIRQMEGIALDGTRTFSWQGKEDSDFWKSMLHDYTEEEDLSSDLTASEVEEYCCSDFYQGMYFQDFSVVWKRLKSHLKNGVADYEKLCRGEQVILALSHRFAFDATEEYREETTLRPGDSIEIQTKEGVLSVEIAGIVDTEESDYGTAIYNLLSGEALGRRIAAADGIDFGYNWMNIELNRFASVQATGKLIAHQCQMYEIQYENNMEWIQKYYQELVQSIMIYGMLSLIILTVYLFILFSILKDRRDRQRIWRKRQRALGLSYQNLYCLELVHGMREGMFLWCSMLILLALKWREGILEYTPDDAVHSHVLQKWVRIDTERQFAFYYVIDYIDYFWSVLFLGLMLLLTVLLYVGQVSGDRKEKEGRYGEK